MQCPTTVEEWVNESISYYNLSLRDNVRQYKDDKAFYFWKQYLALRQIGWAWISESRRNQDQSESSSLLMIKGLWAPTRHSISPKTIVQTCTKVEAAVSLD
jgi:hypothetical protein